MRIVLGKGLALRCTRPGPRAVQSVKRTREDLAVRFNNRPHKYLQTVRPDHRPVVSLVAEKEPEKRCPGKPKGSKNRALSQTRMLGNQISQYLSEVLGKFPNMKEEYVYPII